MLVWRNLWTWRGSFAKSIRCFVFGALGAIPIIGIFTSHSSSALAQKGFYLTGTTLEAAALYWYWLIALVYLQVTADYLL